MEKSRMSELINEILCLKEKVNSNKILISEDKSICQNSGIRYQIKSSEIHQYIYNELIAPFLIVNCSLVKVT